MKKYQSNNESPKQEQLKNTEILFDTIKIAFKEIASNKSTERMQEQYKLYKRTGLEIKGKAIYNDNFLFYNSIYKEVMAFASYLPITFQMNLIKEEHRFINVLIFSLK